MVCALYKILILGLTPLGIASEKGYTEICDLLLTHGADVRKGDIITGNDINVDIY